MKNAGEFVAIKISRDTK